MIDRTDFDLFLQECHRWENSDDLLAVEFKRSVCFTDYVKEAFCAVNGYDYYNRQIFPPGFYRGVVAMVLSRDKRLRDKIIDLKRGCEGVPSSQLTFDFEGENRS